MSVSNVKCEMDAPNFSRRPVPQLKVYISKQLPLWGEIVVTCFLILLYFALSLARIDYNQWVWQQWSLTWCLDVCVIIIKFLIAAVFGVKLRNKHKKVKLCSWDVIKIVAPPGIAYALAMGFSNWGLEWLPMSLYTMTKATTILFIFFFALLFGLEKNSWFLLGIVMMISVGLATFMYNDLPAISDLGIVLGLLGAFANAFRWTAVQYAMQKSKLGLEHPINMIYCIQPWMLLGMIPIAVVLEGSRLFDDIKMDWSTAGVVLAVFGNGVVVFCLEFVEFMIILRTSSLSLFIIEISKILWRNVLADGRIALTISGPNYLGLNICFAGIILYIITKLWNAEEKANQEPILISNPNVEGDSLIPSKTGIPTISDIFDKEHHKYQILMNK